ncbi:nectin-3-like isoform X1 [Erpetoichthys calabaricus]|uniref:nectin-3-like isoform X1 n=1 Tax=Erpetoichthys calabaricus TaxID=27687 RepID=UPI0022344112|nr:nectin-3-like isoform X1 [Erpetoichthys calabaricus]
MQNWVYWHSSLPLPSKYMYSILLFLLLLLRVNGKSRTRVVSEPVSVKSGKNVTINCKLVDTSEVIQQISLQKYTSGKWENFFVISQDGAGKALNEFGKRFSFIGKEQRHASILLQKTSLLDDGEYKCIFTIFPSGTFEDVFRITVYVQPSVTVQSEDIPEDVTTEGVIAVCTAVNGKLKPDMSWIATFEHRVEMNFVVHSNGSSTVQSQLFAVPSRMLNQVEVFCVVEQPVLATKMNTTVNLSITYAPIVTVRIAESESDKMVILCEADANPAAEKFVWKKESDIIGFDNVTSEENRHLTLMLANEGNKQYFCKATNVRGTGVGTFYLKSAPVHRINTAGIIPLLIIILVMGICLWLLVKKRNWKLSQA